MASTGLLGINPYQKGVNLDFSSKPVALAIQLEQKEAAKRDALDKYFMDYEKNIDPSVMRSQDRNIVLEKLNQNKEFYLQNRDKILNPTKYGADFQSQYLANYKDIMSDIARSKAAAKNDELVVRHWSSQKGLNAPKGFDQAVAASHLPVNDPNYRPVDVMKYSFYKTFDPTEYTKKLSSYSVAGAPIPVIDKNGYWYAKRTFKVQPQDESKVMLVGMTDYDNPKNQGFAEFIDDKFSDGVTVQKLQQKYPNTPIRSPRDLAGVFALDFVPTKEEADKTLHAPKVGRSSGGSSGGTGATSNVADNVIGTLFNRGTPTTVKIGGKDITGKIIDLPSDIKGIGNRKIGGTSFSPTKYFMDETTGKTYPIFDKGKPTQESEGIDIFNLQLEINKTYGGQKSTLKFLKDAGKGGGKPGGGKLKTGASILND